MESLQKLRGAHLRLAPLPNTAKSLATCSTFSGVSTISAPGTTRPILVFVMCLYRSQVLNRFIPVCVDFIQVFHAMVHFFLPSVWSHVLCSTIHRYTYRRRSTKNFVSGHNSLPRRRRVTRIGGKCSCKLPGAFLNLPGHRGKAKTYILEQEQLYEQ